MCAASVSLCVFVVSRVLLGLLATRPIRSSAGDDAASLVSRLASRLLRCPVQSCGGLCTPVRSAFHVQPRASERDQPEGEHVSESCNDRLRLLH